jgi:sugar phosphate isomerase/epimerase
MQEDFTGTIEKIVAIGYKELEFAGYFGKSPREVRTLIDRLGVTAPSVHAGLDALQGDFDGVLEAAQIIGHEYIILPWVGGDFRSADGFKRLADLCNEYGRKCKAGGVRFAYHNHDFEFKDADGKNGFDIIAADTDPGLVAFELDLFWITKTGHDPVEYFSRYPGRFPLCHVKDMADITGEQRMVAVGEGEIDFASILRHKDHAGLEHFIVEHDFPPDVMATLQTSYENLAAI